MRPSARTAVLATGLAPAPLLRGLALARARTRPLLPAVRSSCARSCARLSSSSRPSCGRRRDARPSSWLACGRSAPRCAWAPRELPCRGPCRSTAASATTATRESSRSLAAPETRSGCDRPCLNLQERERVKSAETMLPCSVRVKHTRARSCAERADRGESSARTAAGMRSVRREVEGCRVGATRRQGGASSGGCAPPNLN